jgi:hypothetical protein
VRVESPCESVAAPRRRVAPDLVRPVEPATLSIVYNADTVVAAGGDIAISPYNIGVSGRHLIVNKDGTTESRAVMAAKGRDGSIWCSTSSRAAGSFDASTATRTSRRAEGPVGASALFP